MTDPLAYCICDRNSNGPRDVIVHILLLPTNAVDTARLLMLRTVRRRLLPSYYIWSRTCKEFIKKWGDESPLDFFFFNSIASYYWQSLRTQFIYFHFHWEGNYGTTQCEWRTDGGCDHLLTQCGHLIPYLWIGYLFVVANELGELDNWNLNYTPCWWSCWWWL